MCNKVFKKIASVLGAALALGLCFSAVPVQAATSVKGADGYETSYAISDLGDDLGWGSSVDGDAVSYSQQYAEIRYAIPQDVLSAGLVGFKVELSEGDTICLKFYDASLNELTQDYSGAYLAASVDNISVIGIMNMKESESAVKIKSVVFVTTNSIGGEAAPAGNEETKTEDKAETPATTTSSKTGESTTLLWVVCALGGMLLMAAAGMVVTEQKRR